MAGQVFGGKFFLATARGSGCNLRSYACMIDSKPRRATREHALGRPWFHYKNWTGNAKDSVFLCGGFSNWKDATVSFINHEKTSTHKLAVDVVVTLPATTSDVGEVLSTAYAEQRAMNRRCLKTIADNIRFLA